MTNKKKKQNNSKKKYAKSISLYSLKPEDIRDVVRKKEIDERSPTMD